MNDGSTDNFTKETLEELSRRDERIRVINTANRGAAAARNTGIAAARGEYLAFADSDDEYLPGALQHMLAYARKTNADVALFGNLAGGKPLPGHQARQRVLTESERREVTLACLAIVGFDIGKWLVMATTPWAKLFRRTMIVDNGISYPDGCIWPEDAIFNLWAFDSAHTLATDTTLVYDWHTTAGSISSANQPLSRATSMIQLAGAGRMFVAARHAGDHEYEEASIIGTFMSLMEIDHRCLRPALNTPGNEREVWHTLQAVIGSPHVKSQIRRLRIRMLTRHVGWPRNCWGVIAKAWLLGHGLFRAYFLLLVARSRLRRLRA